jgi:hypothetical protein
MADMTVKPIEAISVNELVMARHEVTGATAPRKVRRLFVHDVGKTLRIGLTTGEIIETTDAHRFSTVEGFVDAGSLKVERSSI